jgi:hypothetical protein
MAKPIVFKEETIEQYCKVPIGGVFAAFIFFVIATISNFCMPGDGNQILGVVNLLVSISLGSLLFAWMIHGDI